MKLISMLLLAVFLGKGCDGQEKDLTDAVLEYTAITRGFYCKIEIKNKQVLVYRDANGKQKPEAKTMSDDDWKALVAEFKKFKLEDLPTFKDPTQKRFYDGAAIGELSVTYEGKTYKSKSFDDGTPPVEIASLVEKITVYKPTRE